MTALAPVIPLHVLEAAPRAPEPETRRFRQLQRWLHSLGCCGQCTMYLAIVTVEREQRRTDMVEPPVCSRQRTWKEKSCEELARDHWGERPKR